MKFAHSVLSLFALIYQQNLNTNEYLASSLPFDCTENLIRPAKLLR
jgi:hypothetical protein